MKFFGLICSFFLLISADLMAQPGPPPPDPDAPVPFQGLIYLLLAGAAFGVKKIIGQSKATKD
jgi:hypothetical protein